jgi:hypothetical protein
MPIDQTTEKERNQVSSDGWSLGQIGNIGIFFWKEDDGLGQEIVNTLRGMGCSASSFYYEDLPDLSRIDILLVYGPWGSLAPTAHYLEQMDPQIRPGVVLWQSEQFPNPNLPLWLWRSVGLARSYLESFVFHKESSGGLTPRQHWNWLISKLHRYRYYGDAYRYSRRGFLDVIAVWSQWTAALLREQGIPAITAYMGYSPGCGRDLNLVRDIPVLWLGKRGSSRRSRLLDQIRAQLSEKGIDMLVVDGVEQPYVFGEERTRLLNRSKIVLNLLRKPWDNNSMRFFLASANKATVVSEPVLAHIPFLPEKHFVERPIREIPETIEYYLAHEAERKVIADQAYRLGVEQLTMRASLEKILSAIHHKRIEGSQSALLNPRRVG